MHNLIQWIRSLFCAHEFEYDELKNIEYVVGGRVYEYVPLTTGVMVSRTCKHCGWHKSYKKF